VLLFFHCIASLLWANKRIKLTRKKRRGFLVLVAVGKFNYYQNSLASNFAVNLCESLARASAQSPVDLFVKTIAYDSSVR